MCNGIGRGDTMFNIRSKNTFFFNMKNFKNSNTCFTFLPKLFCIANLTSMSDKNLNRNFYLNSRKKCHFRFISFTKSTSCCNKMFIVRDLLNLNTTTIFSQKRKCNKKKERKRLFLATTHDIHKN